MFQLVLFISTFFFQKIEVFRLCPIQWKFCILTMYKFDWNISLTNNSRSNWLWINCLDKLDLRILYYSWDIFYVKLYKWISHWNCEFIFFRHEMTFFRFWNNLRNTEARNKTAEKRRETKKQQIVPQKSYFKATCKWKGVEMRQQYWRKYDKVARQRAALLCYLRNVYFFCTVLDLYSQLFEKFTMTWGAENKNSTFWKIAITI